MYPALTMRTRAGWEVQLHGIVFEPERHRLMSRALRRLLGFDEEDITPAEAATFNERCQYFLVDNERGKKFSILLDGKPFMLGSSAANGHFQSRFVWKPSASFSAPAVSNGTLSLTVTFNDTAGRTAPLELHFLEPAGVSVISDIDDTIKVSDVLNRKTLLKNTFCCPFKPVTGMADVYRAWESSFDARFHYVSASPWQLYLPLSEFTRSNGFPAGTFHLKEFRVKGRSVLGLFESPGRYKAAVIEPLLRQFPQRQFVFVGDSGEKDPEIYGALARKFPDQVRHIFIRDVTGESPQAPRYQKAFGSVPAEVWQVFKEPREIANSIQLSPHTGKAQ
jgi:phosphatidate phosphatase APP1